MPRLLTIWLNFGATVSDQGKASLFKNEKIDQLIKKKNYGYKLLYSSVRVGGQLSQLIFQFFFFINFM